jgi:hypothetical protein
MWKICGSFSTTKLDRNINSFTSNVANRIFFVVSKMHLTLVPI